MLTATQVFSPNFPQGSRSTPPLPPPPPPPPPVKTPARPSTSSSIYVKPSPSSTSPTSTKGEIVVEASGPWATLAPSPKAKPQPGEVLVVEEETPRAGTTIEVVDDPAAVAVAVEPPSSAWKWWVLGGLGVGVGIAVLAHKRR